MDANHAESSEDRFSRTGASGQVRRFRWPIIAGLFLLAPVIYVLSEAPLRWLFDAPGRSEWRMFILADKLTRPQPVLSLVVRWSEFWDGGMAYLEARAMRSSESIVYDNNTREARIVE